MLPVTLCLLPDDGLFFETIQICVCTQKLLCKHETPLQSKTVETTLALNVIKLS